MKAIAAASALVWALGSMPTAQATPLQVFVGGCNSSTTPCFTDGESDLDSSNFSAAYGPNNAFGIYIGSDSDPSNITGNFTVSWTMTLPSTPAFIVEFAQFQFGIFDDDSSSAFGNGTPVVATFTVNGLDASAALEAAMDAGGGNGDELYRIYTIDLSSVLLGLQNTSSVNFVLTLNGPGLDFLGDTTPSNGAALDFASLTEDVPEPSTVVLTLSGVAGILWFNRRKARKPSAC